MGLYLNNESSAKCMVVQLNTLKISVNNLIPQVSITVSQ